MIIDGIRRATAPGAAAVRGRAGKFSVPASADPIQGTAAAAPALPLDGILALQEQAADAARDRLARQHGQALLHALAALQHAVIDGLGEAESLRHLAMLTAAAPPACDPDLTAILQAIELRARVELARRGL